MISTVPDIALMKQQHRELFAAQPRYLRRLALMTLAVLLYYLFSSRCLVWSGRVC